MVVVSLKESNAEASKNRTPPRNLRMSNPPPNPARTVETEVVDHIPGEERDGQQQTGHATESKSFFHPGSGLAIIGIDVVGFGLNVPTGFLATFFVSAAAFVVTFAVVFGIQRQQASDTVGWAMLKALIGAAAAAVPTPIAGTVLGGAILMLSGLPNSTSKVLGKFKG